jgi:hypothetical protein
VSKPIGAELAALAAGTTVVNIHYLPYDVYIGG